ncbi:MAG: hypothetical protein LBQ58_00915 [Synergistaceae bacterium]|jgi:Tfp pilus assembly protein PilV|nr:hypothetical protein [Synergistaceae bacterium]
MSYFRLRLKFGNVRRGVSLAEMVIAIFVLSFVVLSIMMAMIIATRNTVAHKDEENAYQLALEVLEACERIPFETVSSDYSTRIANISKSGTTSSMQATASVLGMSTAEAGPPGNKLPVSADIQVEVTWSATMGGKKSITMRREVSVSGWQNVGDRSF